MMVCDVCRSGDKVRTYPWGRTVPQGEFGSEPHGDFDLCESCQEALSKDGLAGLLRPSERQP